MIALWRGKYDKPRKGIKKQRHHFADEGKSMVFPVVMYGCKSWTLKKTECQRIDALLLNCGVGEDS